VRHILENLNVIGNLELSALSLLFLVLHAFRRVIGSSVCYAAAGLFFVLACILDIPEFYLGEMLTGTPLHGISYSMIWLPFLMLLLVIYERDSTLEAHRYALSILVLYGCYICISQLLINTTPLEDLILSFRDAKFAFHVSLRSSYLLIAVHLLSFLVVPVIFQTLRNRRQPYFFCLLLSFCVYAVLNESLLKLIYVHNPQSLEALSEMSPRYWQNKLLSMLFCSVLGQIFLGITSERFQRRNSFSFISQIFSYFQSPSWMRQTLSESLARYEFLVENSNDYICILNDIGILLNANKKTIANFGHSLLSNDKFRLWEYLESENGKLPPWQETWNNLKSDANYLHQQSLNNLKLHLPDKQAVDIELNLTLAAVNGKEVVLFIARDVTAQKAEARNRQNLAEQMMNSQKLESIGLLAGGIAHDFNNLLLSIRASLDILLQRKSITGQDGHLLDNVSEACHRAETLTSQLLGFARRGNFTKKVVNVQTLVEKSVNLFRPTAKKLDIRLVLEPVCLQVSGDENQLSQALLNILFNGRDACLLEPRTDDQPPPRLTIRTEEATDEHPGWEFHPEGAKADDYICIQVRDNGCGMSEEVRKKIFDPFFTTKKQGQGTGMGLPMVYGCIANHQGWLHVVSELGQGTTFFIFLPKYRPASNETAQNPDNAKLTTTTENAT